MLHAALHAPCMGNTAVTLLHLAQDLHTDSYMQSNGRSREANRLPPGAAGMRAESCKDGSVMHADIVRVILTGRGRVPRAAACWVLALTRMYGMHVKALSNSDAEDSYTRFHERNATFRATMALHTLRPGWWGAGNTATPQSYTPATLRHRRSHASPLYRTVQAGYKPAYDAPHGRPLHDLMERMAQVFAT